jgi:hypothetical protein
MATGARTPLTPARPTNTSAPYAPVPAGAAGPCTLAVATHTNLANRPSCDDRGDYLPVQVSLLPAPSPQPSRAGRVLRQRPRVRNLMRVRTQRLTQSEDLVGP